MYNGFPHHHGPAEAWQVGMLYNLVYNRDCMIHEIVRQPLCCRRYAGTI